MDQRGDEWFRERWGKFTASTFYKLMSSGRGKDQIFGKVALGYINEKIDEIITSHDVDMGNFAGNKATEWGEYWETPAREAFEEKTGLKVDLVGFILIEDFFGGSPDGYIKDHAIIEIKCPFSTVNHTENLFLKDENDFRDAHEDYYIQMQVNMMAMKVDKGYFISYDPRKLQASLKLKIIEVQKNETICAEILMKYHEAMKIVSEKQKQLYELIN